MRCILPTVKTMKIKFFAASVLVLSVYLFLSYLVIEVWFMKNNSPTAVSSVVLPYVIVHIDLKGAPPKLRYLESLLPTLKNHGVNGLLIEYEDMFPYEGKLANISAQNCYGKTELKSFLKKAAESDFEIIPLIQTLGHLEYVLKLKEFRHLREVPAYPDSLCPSKLESRAMIKHMLEQVINFHTDIAPLKYIHIGLDEVFHINKCEQCLSKDLTNMEIFIGFIEFLSKYLKEKSPNTTALMWDDMLRSIKPIEWNSVNFPSNIEPVYWDYEPSVRVSHLNLLNYHRKFQGLWIASAYKGADGTVKTIPNVKDRSLNHFSWMNLILNYKFGGETRIFNYKGIFLTGWSRYSHMDPLCELLPTAIPSLILNLLLIKEFKSGIIADNDANTDVGEFFDKYLSEDFKTSLKCTTDVDFETFDIQTCNFDSNQLYTVLTQYELIKSDIESGFNNDKSILSSVEYYADKKFMNMNNLMENINWVNNTLKELNNVEDMMNYFMKRYFDKHVINEYVNYKTYSAKKKLKAILAVLNNYKLNRIWERKPILDTSGVPDNTTILYTYTPGVLIEILNGSEPQHIKD